MIIFLIGGLGLFVLGEYYRDLRMSLYGLAVWLGVLSYFVAHLIDTINMAMPALAGLVMERLKEIKEKAP